MEPLRSQDCKDFREGRRLRAVELWHQGWKQKAIAEALGVTEGAVSQWLARAQQGGVDALRKRKASGAPARLSLQQKAQIPDLLRQGAPTFGFVGDVWTCARVGEVIRRSFGVSYHPAHVSRLIRALDWSLQKPEFRATQRDEALILWWKEQEFPRLKRGR